MCVVHLTNGLTPLDEVCFQPIECVTCNKSYVDDGKCVKVPSGFCATGQNSFIGRKACTDACIKVIIFPSAHRIFRTRAQPVLECDPKPGTANSLVVLILGIYHLEGNLSSYCETILVAKFGDAGHLWEQMFIFCLRWRYGFLHKSIDPPNPTVLP